MKNSFLLLSGFILFSSVNIAQPVSASKKFTALGIGFWNVENFYDTLDDPKKMDDDFTPSGMYQWNSQRYKNKIEHLAEVIDQTGKSNVKNGLAILGLCEVENRRVLDDLVLSPKLAGRNYRVILREGPDARGVDPALLYNPDYFEPIWIKSVHVILPDSFHKTRDELLVCGHLLKEKFYFIVCHWPSRRGDEVENEVNRIAAAKTAKRIIDSIQNYEKDARIILMGDLNDEPVNTSVKKILNTSGDAKNIKPGQLFNAMDKLYRKGIGTLAHNDVWSLFDQQILSPPLVKRDFKDLQFLIARVFNEPFLCEEYGKYKGYPLRTYAGGNYRGGYSDHFPVYSIFMKEK